MGGKTKFLDGVVFRPRICSEPIMNAFSITDDMMSCDV